MKYFFYSIIVMLALSCKSNQKSISAFGGISGEYVHFERIDSATSTNKKFRLTQKFTLGNDCELLQKGTAFYRNHRQPSLYEVYDSRFLALSFYPKHAAGTHTAARNSVQVYDMATTKSYNLQAANYIIEPAPPVEARFSTETILKAKQDKVILHAYANRFDIENNRVILLLGDLKTRDTIELREVFR